MFLLSLIQANYSRPVIKNVFYAVKFYHEILDINDPTEGKRSIEVFEVSKRVCRGPNNKKLPLQVDDLRNIHEQLICQDSDDVQQWRLYTLVIIGFTGFLRYDELIHIRVGDVSKA